MHVGYARVSRFEQHLDLQRDALTAADCEQIFVEQASGARDDRPELERALQFARSGDTLVVWKLDRLGRSLKHLIATIEALEQRGIGLKSLTEQLDTTTPGGKLIFHLFGALAEFERSLIRERTLAGLAAARARGRQGGRPKLLDERKAELARRLHADKANSIADICRALQLGRSTLYRYLRSPHDPEKSVRSG